MYQTLYDLIVSGVFNGVVSAFQDEIVQVLATCGSLVIVAMPFVAILACFKFVWSLVRW